MVRTRTITADPRYVTLSARERFLGRAALETLEELRPGSADCGDSSDATAAIRPELESRFRRSKSVRISVAVWQRSLRSFSSALLIRSSRRTGKSGFSRTGGTGARFKMQSKITPEVSPRNGNAPVDISYKTTPKENKSVRASSSLPRTCSGDI